MPIVLPSGIEDDLASKQSIVDVIRVRFPFWNRSSFNFNFSKPNISYGYVLWNTTSRKTQAMKTSSLTDTPLRVIGIRHRQKANRDNKERPTAICIAEGGDIRDSRELLCDTDELEIDFAQGFYPVKFRNATALDKVEDFRPHHLKWKLLKESEEANGRPTVDHPKKKEAILVLDKVPSKKVTWWLFLQAAQGPCLATCFRFVLRCLALQFTELPRLPSSPSGISMS
jgi:hypothetical protein